ncbi:MAG: zinc ribbon domain-containing protein [Ruminococcus sp.]|nr:zinc ribbon domain-containing protein [Ruminococcus sp.]
MQTYQNGFNPFSQNIAIVKSYFKKPTVLTQGILYAISAVLTIVSGFIMSPVLNNYFSVIMKMPGFTDGMSPSELEFFTTFMNVYIDIVPIAAIVPSVIISAITAAAFILIYNKSKNADPASTPKSGIVTLFVLSIVQLVPIIMLSVMLVLAIILLAVAAIAASGTPESGILWVVTAVYTLVFGTMIALLLMYYINQVRYYNSIRKSLTTINLTYKGAGIFGVFSIIYGVYMVMNAFSVFSIKPMMQFMAELAPEMEFIAGLFDSFTPLFIVSTVASVLSAAIMILNGVIALGYKKHIRSFTEGYSEFGIDNSVAPQPVSVPVYSAPVSNEPAQPVAPVQTNEPQFEPVIFNEGQAVTQATHCPRCGTPVKNDDVFCKACGTKL